MSYKKKSLSKRTTIQCINESPYRETPDIISDVDDVKIKLDDYEERFKVLENIEIMTLKTNFLWPMIVFCLVSPLVATFLFQTGESLFGLVMYFMSFFSFICLLSFCLQITSPKDKW